jgi:hypothetical protein
LLYNTHEDLIMDQDYEVFATKMEEQYPKMFAEQYGGFAVSAGWWPILEALCANIQQHLDWKNRDGEVVPQVVVEQIKEKFGGLRFYYQGGDEQIHGMVRMAEAWAANCCEDCCAPGKRRSGGWIRTLCDKHEEEHQERKRTQEMKASGFEE